MKTIMGKYLYHITLFVMVMYLFDYTGVSSLSLNNTVRLNTTTTMVNETNDVLGNNITLLTLNNTDDVNDIKIYPNLFHSNTLNYVFFNRIYGGWDDDFTWGRRNGAYNINFDNISYTTLLLLSTLLT